MYHLATDKLLKLLKLVRSWEIDERTKQLLEQTAKHCDACQRFSSSPVRLKCTLRTEE